MATPTIHRVPSESDPKKAYTVTVSEGYSQCTCPAWERSRFPAEERICKHIEKVTGELRRGDGRLADYETAWLIRQLVGLTDKSFQDIAHAVTEELYYNQELSEYERTLGENIVMTLEKLWPREGQWPPGPDAQQALDFIQRALQKEESSSGGDIQP